MQSPGKEPLIPFKRTAIVILAAGLFVFLLYLYFFVNFNDFSLTIQQADPLFYSLAFAAMIGSTAFYSLTWQRLLHILSVKASFVKAFQAIWVGGFVDLLIPAESISGDICRIYLVGRESGENVGRVAASVIGHRVLSMIITLGALLTSSAYFIIVYRPPLLVLVSVGIIAAATLAMMILIFYLSTRRQVTSRLVNWIVSVVVRLSRGHWKFDSLKQSADTMLNSFHDGIGTLSVHRKRLVAPLSLGVVAWLLDLLIAVLVFHALNTPVPFSALAVVYSITIAVQTIPLGVPGEVGILDVLMATLYTLMGVPIAVSAVATVLIRILTLWVRLLIGGITAQWLGIKGLRAPDLSGKT